MLSKVIFSSNHLSINSGVKVLFYIRHSLIKLKISFETAIEISTRRKHTSRDGTTGTKRPLKRRFRHGFVPFRSLFPVPDWEQ